MSMQVYANHAEQVLDPHARFDKWAAVEVHEQNDIPHGMHAYSLRGGLYAVFTHYGPATDFSTFKYVYGEWLPACEYPLDHREHFELLPEGYDPFAANAHEEYWIPVKLKR